MDKFMSELNIDIKALPVKDIIIGEDLAIITCDSNSKICEKPIKIDKSIVVACLSGCCRMKVNLQEYDVESPALVTLLPGQFFEIISVSANFKSYTVVASNQFSELVNLPGWQQKYLDMYNNPITNLDDDSLIGVQVFFAMLYHAASNKDNPFRLQVVENLIRVFYYGGVHKSKYPAGKSAQHKNNVVEQFLDLVHQHYREERMIGFYADRLCITPKYLSKIVKENTGRSAGEWIENYVMLEARTMLHNSDMTIQQIAVALNFPNQSFFGKYFKRATGMSPKQYRSSCR